MQSAEHKEKNTSKKFWALSRELQAANGFERFLLRVYPDYYPGIYVFYNTTAEAKKKLLHAKPDNMNISFDDATSGLFWTKVRAFTKNKGINRIIYKDSAWIIYNADPVAKDILSKAIPKDYEVKFANFV